MLCTWRVSAFRACDPHPHKRPHNHGKVTTRVAGKAPLASLIREHDSNNDGLLTIQEVENLIAQLETRSQREAGTATLTHQTTSPIPSKTSKPLRWDQSLVAGVTKPRALQACIEFCCTKLSNRHKNRVTLSDIVWSFLGMYVSMLLLGQASLHARNLPLVHSWHEQGLNLLLGSFGTITVMLFGRPDAEAIKPWNLVVGHVGSIAISMACLAALGPGVVSRALAMAAAMVVMLLTDSVHPPGGALILMAQDSAAIRGMKGWFLVYPSLAWTLVVLLPLGAAINWLKQHACFDWPGGHPGGCEAHGKQA